MHPIACQPPRNEFLVLHGVRLTDSIVSLHSFHWPRLVSCRAAPHDYGCKARSNCTDFRAMHSSIESTYGGFPHELASPVTGALDLKVGRRRAAASTRVVLGPVRRQVYRGLLHLYLYTTRCIV
jgi:hypothetical protein